ncbi:MAG: hypothetical protein ILNGONEN_02228 [Syntrophorhabdaceae bacterium]|jgi:hypothetical protein|nr:hypothetical protein [Syntrophorhabdaceae bacterium]
MYYVKTVIHKNDDVTILYELKLFTIFAKMSSYFFRYNYLS